MIVFGCIARNFFGWLLTDMYPVIWADWGRQMCLSFILMRGGMQLDYSGHGIEIIFLVILPQLCELICGSFLIKSIFNMPPLVTGLNAVLLSALSPGIIVPNVMIMIENKLGTGQRIPQLMLASCTTENIIAVKIFNIFMYLALNSAKPPDH